MDSYHQTPINGNAARVTKKASIDDEFVSKFRSVHLGTSYWSVPKTHIDMPRNPNFSNLTGTKFGRLEVMGYLGKGKWQCRCSCGFWVKRKGAVIQKSLKDRSQMCPECYEVCILRRRDIQRRTGKYADWDSIG